MRLVAVCLLVAIAASVQPQDKPRAAASGARMNSAVSDAPVTYHGWPGSFMLNNGKVEVVVVPAIDRVMQFHFVGEDAMLWENPATQGKAADATAKDWQNFGGDKSWPAPQDDWPKQIGRGWPPPAGFDSVPVHGIRKGNTVDLESPIDPAYGIRIRRHIELDPLKPVMTITTTYEKLRGDPVRVGIGVITQLRDPLRVFMVLPPKSQFPKGYALLQFDPPHDAQLDGRLFSLTRSPSARSQIGSDADTLLWMNDRYVLRIDSPRVAGAGYADQGCNTVIYTNAGPEAYVELETFGPLISMKVGDQIERTNTYTLMRRTEKDLNAEARHIVASSANQ